MEVWGGIECSINRVDEDYFDQFEYDNLYDRPELLDYILDLGIKTLRFPVLWEKAWPDKHVAPDWAVKKQLERLREKKVRVIAGLVHHGSGPRYAQIQDENFAEQLAIYARMVAQKFPWIEDYTPINEPLTTARFCGLYGLWHPHSKNDKAFLNILINECRATVKAMQAIREVNPKARLVLTEDLTRIHGTKEMEAQTTFENHRRWLSIDLLCGKVDNNHPLWTYLIEHGIDAHRLRFFSDNPMPPDVLGFNYYVTSERYLDHELDKHPASTHGGNGQMAYADIEAVRHPDAKLAGLANLMREAYHRYKLPMAVTEAHLSCGREDQLRWLKSIWEDCITLNEQGVNVIAVTFWSLFGAYGWDKLLIQRKGNYESGAFDMSSGLPRVTAIARFIATLAKGQSYHSPIINGQGWWQRQSAQPMTDRPILIIGNSETLGATFAKICAERNLACITADRTKIDISNRHQVQGTILKYRAWAIINTGCDVGVYELQKGCKDHNIHLLSFSSAKLPPNNSIKLDNDMLICCPVDIVIERNSDLVHASLDLLIDQENGIWHPAAQGTPTWYKLC